MADKCRSLSGSSSKKPSTQASTYKLDDIVSQQATKSGVAPKASAALNSGTVQSPPLNHESEAGPADQARTGCEKRLCYVLISVVGLWCVSVLDMIDMCIYDSSKKHQLLTQTNSIMESGLILAISGLFIVLELVFSYFAGSGGPEQKEYRGSWGIMTPDKVLVFETAVLGELHPHSVFPIEHFQDPLHFIMPSIKQCVGHPSWIGTNVEPAVFTIVRLVVDTSVVLRCMRIVVGVFQFGFFPGTISALVKHSSRASFYWILSCLVAGIPLSFALGGLLALPINTKLSSEAKPDALMVFIAVKLSLIIVVLSVFLIGICLSKGYFPCICKWFCILAFGIQPEQGHGDQTTGNITSVRRTIWVWTIWIRYLYKQCLSYLLLTGHSACMFFVTTINIFTVPKLASQTIQSCMPATSKSIQQGIVTAVYFSAMFGCLGTAYLLRDAEKMTATHERSADIRLRIAGLSSLACTALGLVFMVIPSGISSWLRFLMLFLIVGGSFISLLTIFRLLLDDLEEVSMDFGIILELGIGNLGCTMSDFVARDGEVQYGSRGLQALFGLTVVELVVFLAYNSQHWRETYRTAKEKVDARAVELWNSVTSLCERMMGAC